MDYIIIRGHHLRDFGEYVFLLEERGKSHQEIIERYLEIDKNFGRGDGFERNVARLFKRIYEVEAPYIELVNIPDDICRGIEK